MLHSPFGGISLILNILIICIGVVSRFVSRHSVTLARAITNFMDSFIDAKNDTLIRRIFAGSIPFAMSITITSGIVFSFLTLLRDDNRVPLYTVPMTAYGYIASTDEGKWVVNSLKLPRTTILSSTEKTTTPPVSPDHSLIPVQTNQTDQEIAASTSIAAPGSTESPVPGSSGSSSNKENKEPQGNMPLTELHSSLDTATSSQLPRELTILGASSLTLTELLKANSIDDSRHNKEKLALLLGLPAYKGSSAEDYTILRKLQEIQAHSYSLNR